MIEPEPIDFTTPYDIAAHLTEMREQAGLTIAQAALRSRMDYDTLRYWEQGGHLRQFMAVLNQFERYGCSIRIVPPKVKYRKLAGPALTLR